MPTRNASSVAFSIRSGAFKTQSHKTQSKASTKGKKKISKKLLNQTNEMTAHYIKPFLRTDTPNSPRSPRKFGGVRNRLPRETRNTSHTNALGRPKNWITYNSGKRTERGGLTLRI